MAQRIQLRRGTAAEWAAANPVLAVGEPGVETDTGKQKFGDGVTPWNSRPYASKGDTGPVGPPNTDASLLATGTVPDGRLPARLSDSQLTATYVPKWKPNTAYLAGDAVLSPSGDTVTAKTGFTSGASYNAVNWNLSPSYSKKRSYVAHVDDFGADPTGVADSSVALEAAAASLSPGGAIILGKGTYLWLTNGALDLGARGVSLIGQGPASRIMRKNWTVNGGFIRARGSISTSAINLSANAVAGARTITVTSTTGITPDSWYTLGSTRQINPYMGALQGENIRIKSVDSSTQLALWGTLRDSYATSDAASILLVTPAVDIILKDFAIEDAEPNQHPQSFIEVQWAKNVVIEGIEAKYCGAAVAYLDSVIDSRIKISTQDQPDNTSTGFVGYGVAAMRLCENLEVDVVARRGRHAFTTLAAPTAQGVPRSITVTGTAMEMTGPAWDTHPEGMDILFKNCIASGGAHAGFNLRGARTRVHGGQATDCGSGAWIVGGSASGSVIDGLEISNVYDISTGHGNGIRISGPHDGVTVSNVRVDGADYSGINFALPDGGATGTDPTNVIIKNVDVRNAGRKNVYKTAVRIGVTAVPTFTVDGLTGGNTRADGLMTSLIEKESGGSKGIIQGTTGLRGYGLAAGAPLVINIDTTTGRIRQSPVDPVALVGITQGTALYYAPQGNAGTSALTNGVLGLAPLDVNRECTLTGLAGEVTTAGSTGSQVILAIYGDDGTGAYPGALIAASSAADGTVVGIKDLAIAATTIKPGRYWVGAVGTGAPTTAPVVRTISNGGLTMPSATPSTGGNFGASMAGITTTPPASFATSRGFTFAPARVQAKLG